MALLFSQLSGLLLWADKPTSFYSSRHSSRHCEMEGHWVDIRLGELYGEEKANRQDDVDIGLLVEILDFLISFNIMSSICVNEDSRTL